jgi:hypothetical protein
LNLAANQVNVPARAIGMITPDHILLGHALRDGPDRSALLAKAAAIVSGSTNLEPREATDPKVYEAESLLGIDPARRPIYVFLGDIHPDLGDLGLVIEREACGGAIHGITRCDSGGLYIPKGFFELAGDDTARRRILTDLSTPNTFAVGEWEAQFSAEIAARFEGDAESYVRGDPPRCDGWTCPRAAFVTEALLRTPRPDRRLWTWEIRLARPPRGSQFVAVVLPPELSKLDDPDEDTPAFPPHVRVIHEPHPGTTKFRSDAARRALMGAKS